MPAQFAWFFLSFKGRISRQEFWLGYALTIVVVLLLVPRMQDLMLAQGRPASGPWTRRELDTALLLGKMLPYAVIAWPVLTLYVKRLHDLDFSGWWLLGFFVAVAVVDASGIVPRSYLSVAFFAVVGFVPGKRGDNRFGSDPIVTRAR